MVAISPASAASSRVWASAWASSAIRSQEAEGDPRATARIVDRTRRGWEAPGLQVGPTEITIGERGKGQFPRGRREGALIRRKLAAVLVTGLLAGGVIASTPDTG